MNIQALYSVRTICRQQIQYFVRAKNWKFLSNQEADRLFLDVDNAIQMAHPPRLSLHAAIALLCVRSDKGDNFLATLQDCSTIEDVDALIEEILHGR